MGCSSEPSMKFGRNSTTEKSGYCFAWKSWLVWTGTHWERDDTDRVHQFAKATIKRLARHVETLDEEHAKALLTHVKKSLSKAALDAMVRTAQDEPGIPIKPDA